MSDFVLLMAILVGRVVKHLWRQETAEIQSSSDLLVKAFFSDCPGRDGSWSGSRASKP